jgi:carboxypeptidase D
VADAQNETVIAAHFQGFLQEFRQVFADVQERVLYIAGESYAGKYIGYIADRLLQEQANPFHLKGVMLIDRKWHISRILAY